MRKIQTNKISLQQSRILTYQAEDRVDREDHQRAGLMEETKSYKKGNRKLKKCLDILTILYRLSMKSGRKKMLIMKN